jgi:hypothetical protein
MRCQAGGVARCRINRKSSSAPSWNPRYGWYKHDVAFYCLQMTFCVTALCSRGLGIKDGGLGRVEVIFFIIVHGGGNLPS